MATQALMQYPDTPQIPHNMTNHIHTVDSDAAQDKATALVATDTLFSVANIVTWTMVPEETVSDAIL